MFSTQLYQPFERLVEKIETSKKKNGDAHITDRWQSMMTKRLNNPNH